MPKNVQRGFVITDQVEFTNGNIDRLKKAQEEILLLLDRGYSLDKLVTFVGNHYLLSARQRLALLRATGTSESIFNRKRREIVHGIEGEELYIDGLNQIITLEVALSRGTLIFCMDGTIRDLAGLRGTYRLIDKTDIAIDLLGKKLYEKGIRSVNFFLDAPVSNTVKLKQRIAERLTCYPYEVKIEVIRNPDVVLEVKKNVVTSDAIILNKCKSWINISREIIEDLPENIPLIDLSTGFRTIYNK